MMTNERVSRVAVVHGCFTNKSLTSVCTYFLFQLQCASHLNLGWRITVMDPPIPTTTPPPTTPPPPVSVLIGSLPTEQHRVSGKFHIIGTKTLFFEDFNYDGGGPGEYAINRFEI